MPSSSEGFGAHNKVESAVNTFPTKYCRLCALELKSGVFIFGPEGKRLEIPEKIRKTLGILVLEEDTLPKKICTDCCSSLEDYAKYKDTVLDAQEKLASIAKNLEKSLDSELLRCSPNPPIPKYSPNGVAKKTKILEFSKDDQIVAVPDCLEVKNSPSSSTSLSRQESHGETNNNLPKAIPVKCGFCPANGEIFYERQKVLAHIAKMHPEMKHKLPKFRCSECSKMTEKYTALRAHAYRHRMAGTHRCSEPNCDKSYSLKSMLDAHTLSKHCQNPSGRAFSCKNCGKRFHTKTGLASHITTKHLEETLKILGPRDSEDMSEDSSLPDGVDDMIEPTLPTSDRLLRSSAAVINSETGDTSNTIISPTTTTTSGLNKVLRKIPVYINNSNSPDEEKDYDRENQQFKKFSLPITTSLESTHTEVSDKTTVATLGAEKQKLPKLWHCTVCGKTLTSNTGYHNHVMTHKGRRFDCDVCGVSYMQKATLVHHKKVHHVNTPKKFKCEVCSKEFHELKFLNQHAKIHSAPSPEFQCHICHKIYKTGRCLRRHCKLHTSTTKKHVCNLCGKAFRVKSKLDEHENSHTGKKPLGCQFCDKAFNGHPNYVKHMRRKHPTEINRDNKIPPPNKIETRVQAETVTSSCSIEVSLPTTTTVHPAEFSHNNNNNGGLSQPPQSSSQTTNWHSIPGKNYLNPSGGNMSVSTNSSAMSVNALDLVDCAIQSALVGETNNNSGTSNHQNNNNGYDGQMQSQSEPMELSYKLSAFQDMPMELTKVFQRDPLELCVRQDLVNREDLNQLMDLSSRVDTSGIVSMSMNMAGVNVHRLDLTERELMDLSGAFRQPIDLISRTDDTAHDLYNEGSLVDLSLRSNFGQDQSASSFLRELIDLSSRSDSFHGELDLTKPHHPQQQHSTHHSNSTNSGIPNSHGSSTNGMSAVKITPTAGNNVGTSLQNVIYQDAMDTMYA